MEDRKGTVLSVPLITPGCDIYPGRRHNGVAVVMKEDFSWRYFEHQIPH
jgi:hypothetical protein